MLYYESSKRVFKLKSFSRWVKKVLADAQLCDAAREIERGHYEADLGAGLCKKRIAVAGRVKRGATRVLVAKGGADGIFFIAGRRKSDSGPDFSDSHVAQAQLIGEALQKADTKRLDMLSDDGTLEEICHGIQED
jgi:hypothetical protein